MDAQRAKIAAAFKAAEAVAQRGPQTITLGDDAKIQLPAGEAFIPAAEANKVMVALGNQAYDGRRGMILPTDGKADWMIVVDRTSEGYVRDGDAKEWQPDAMLDSLKEGTEAGNKERIAQGIPALDIIGWVEPPKYDAAAHRLVWSLEAKDRGVPDSAPRTINYNTYALGRDGFYSMNLLSSSETIAQDKPVVQHLLATLQFNDGQRYENFNASTDKVAAYGLAALVGAVAIKKLGLLAGLGIFLIKIWKLALVALAAGGAAIRRFFKRGEDAV
jgi:uncharacterized membrane-anchored protein